MFRKCTCALDVRVFSFFCYGTLKRMCSTPSAVPHVCKAVASFITLPSQPLVELNSSTAIFLLLSPEVIFSAFMQPVRLDF